jgi:hypothetical protein
MLTTLSGHPEQYKLPTTFSSQVQSYSAVQKYIATVLLSHDGICCMCGRCHLKSNEYYIASCYRFPVQLYFD